MKIPKSSMLLLTVILMGCTTDAQKSSEAQNKLLKTPPEAVRKNLLELVEPKQDRLIGEWQKQDGKLYCTTSDRTLLEIPYEPPMEYDLSAEITRTGGNDDFMFVLRHGEAGVSWVIGGYGNTTIGFHLVNGAPLKDNTTAKRMSAALNQNQKYICQAKVRNTGVQVFVDGALVSELKTDYSNVEVEDIYRLRGKHTIGIGTHSSYEISKLEIAEISGAGKPTRGR